MAIIFTAIQVIPDVARGKFFELAPESLGHDPYNL